MKSGLKDMQKEFEWLNGNPSLEELRSRYPEDWSLVEMEVAQALSGGNTAVQQYLKRLSARASASPRANGGFRNSTQHLERLLTDMVRYRMAHQAVSQHLVSVASGVESGKIRFNLINGLIAQKLLFTEGLERKPVSMFWFRLIWPLLWQKRLLMPLVQPEGIYCFYSAELIAALAELIGGRSCCELAAGDGTLARFLGEKGVSVTATDDYSWSGAVKYPEQVAMMDAKDALAVHAPEVVLCSWPPAGNGFERQIFRTKSVQMYILIASRHQFAAGNWSEYCEQNGFSFGEEKGLSRLVLPPELDPAVYVFRRK